MGAERLPARRAARGRARGTHRGLARRTPARGAVAARHRRRRHRRRARLVSGTHRHVAGYLASEVLEGLDSASRMFLLRTSVLDRLSGELCDQVLAVHGSGPRLRALERSNLFLTALDDEGRWFRYHELFRDLLRAQLDPGSPPRCAGALPGWFREAGLIDKAVEYARSGRRRRRGRRAAGPPPCAARAPGPRRQHRALDRGAAGVAARRASRAGRRGRDLRRRADPAGARDPAAAGDRSALARAPPGGVAALPRGRACNDRGDLRRG